MPKPNPDALVAINAGRSDHAVSQQFMAIVSPCSQCQNFQSDPTKGFPMCPRRYWMEQAEQAAEIEGLPKPPAYLTETGTDSDDQLANPVHSGSNQITSVWVAAVEDNRRILNGDGTVATGSLLDPGFDTRYIRCRLTPAVPAMHQAGYWASGAMKELDQLVVTALNSFQETFELGQASGSPVLIQGFAQKVNFAFSFTQTTPSMDRLANGV